jgi:hypothetical protein
MPICKYSISLAQGKVFGCVWISFFGDCGRQKPETEPNGQLLTQLLLQALLQEVGGQRFARSAHAAAASGSWTTSGVLRTMKRDLWCSVAVLNAVLRSVLKNVHVTNKVLFYAMANVVLFVVK